MSLTPRFSFSTNSSSLTLDSDTYISGPIASPAVQGFIAKHLATAGGATADRRIICGMIPFNPEAPAFLLAGKKPQEEAEKADSASRALGTIPAQLEPDTAHNEAEAQNYREAVTRALKIFETGRLQKIVLARSSRYRYADQGRLSLAGLKAALQANNPAADAFSLTLPEGDSWVGASPEIVADLRGKTFYTHPLAGSRSKAEGLSLEDARQELLGSAKDLTEHAYVVDDIRRLLAEIPGLELDIPSNPVITETDSMYHLGTPIRARVPTGLTALELALKIHPTPAVCGTPTSQSMALIPRLERSERNFYAGLVGWMDDTGQGRWSLVLRCAHMTAEQIVIWAGAGIVAGSDPEAELAETGAKMQTVYRAALKAGQV